MSNNNHPHGNLSQTAQNPSWNPLQIPSYIPRQPQLAHMSNERSLVRSPLAWHASTQPPPPTPDAIYNFMSANHKNLDHHHQMNPLLAPPYTGTLPFDSMDLSLQSSRSAAPALTKAGQQPQQQQSQQQQHQHQSHLHAPPNYPTIHNLTTNTPVGAQQGHLQGIPASASPSSAANKYLNANGAADCESLLPAPPSTPPNNNNNHNSNNNSTSTNTNSSSSSSSGNNNAPPPHYMQNRDENFKLTQLKNIQKNTELGSKECNYGTSGATGKLATHSMQHQQQNAKKPSPLRNYHQQQQQQQPQPYNVTKYNGPQTPPTHQSPLDYNQLHLHHQLHAGVGGYAPHQQQQQHQHMQEQQQQQQQQHHQHQQHLHYAPPQTLHNQHLAPPLLPPPPTSLIASAQFQQQQQLRQQQQTQLQQQLTPPPHSSPQQTHTTQMHSRNTQLTNLDILSKHKSAEEEHHGTNEETIITDLSTTTAAHRSSTNTEDKQLAEAPESPYMTTSNEESLESNSNSSNSRKRRKRKASQVMRLTPSDNAIVKRQRTPSPLSNSCSPKRSPKNGEFQPFKGMKEQQQQQQKDLELPQENGRATPPAVVAAADNSNSSTLYNDTTTDNPKTKKQRQALLQRNRTERQHQQQQHETGNQVADEHQPGATNAASETTKLPPPSPHSNSSSSSSSSSSAVSHSSHSSQASETPIDKEKQQEQHQQQQHLDNNKAITDTPASPALVEQGDIDAKPAVSVHDDEDEVVSPAAKQSPLPVATAPSVTATTVATTDAADGADAVTTFNEVEDKLEQMFAGIEDEPAVQAADAARGPHDLSAHFSLDSDKSAELIKSAAGNAPATSVPNTPTTSTLMLATEIRPVATKAAMKSKLPSPIHSPSPTVAVSVATSAIATSAVAAALPPNEMPPTATPAVPAIAVAASAKVVPRTPPTRCLPPRRLSMGMDPSLLRFTIGEQQKPKKTPGRKKQQPPSPPPLPTPLEMEIVQLDSDDDKPSTSAAAAAALAARKLSEATAAAAAAAALAAAAKTPANTKVNNTTKKQNKNNKKNTPKGKKPTGKSVAKQNGNKKSFASGGRKNFSTDEDSTPAPNGVTSAPDLRFKSPFILIKPDGSISIKNTHNAEDVNEKQTKKKHTKAPHERKNLRGMHSSTLSNRYDADTTDSSWICVFCKCGPHKLGLGDLFGPYLVSIDCEEYRTAVQVPAGSHDIDGLFVSKRKRADMVKVQQRNLPVVAATLANIMQAPKITMHKRKRKTTHDSVYSCSDDPNESQCSSQDPLDCSHETKFIETFRGMSKTSEHGYEIWLHEDCAVWANDIHLIGAHVNGLDAAVWESTRYQCVHCAQPGANICCFHRACKAAAHVPCARVASWSLSEQDRKVYCQLHAADKSSDGPTATVAAPAAIPTTMSAINVEQTAAPPPTFNINSLP